MKEILTCFFSLSLSFLSTVRPPLHDIQAAHRLHVRHLPAVSLPKLGATNNAPATTNTNTSTANRFQANHLFLQSLTTPTTQSMPHQPKRSSFKYNKYGVESVYNKPRTITIVKQGSEKPHKMITILLNRRTAQTFDQLLSDISEAFGYQKHRGDRVCVTFERGNPIEFFFSLDQTDLHSQRSTS